MCVGGVLHVVGDISFMYLASAWHTVSAQLRMSKGMNG